MPINLTKLVPSMPLHFACGLFMIWSYIILGFPIKKSAGGVPVLFLKLPPCVKIWSQVSLTEFIRPKRPDLLGLP